MKTIQKRWAQVDTRTASGERRTVQEPDLVRFVLRRNEVQCEEFCSPGAALARRLYRAQHPTEIIALKCMDGRLNLAVTTGTPPGIIKPYRNIGGKFDLGWPFFGRLILDDVEYAVSKGRPVLVLSTYHFSKGDVHRGCAGYGYDTEAAKKGAARLREQFDGAFGGDHRAVDTIVLGIETDDDALVFHGEEGGVYDVSAHLDDSPEAVQDALAALYPSMLGQSVSDLVPLALGNQQFVRAKRSDGHSIATLQHGEQIIAVGRGFDWLHLPNRALIVGPYDPNWEHAVATAGSIVLANMKEKRVPEKEGALLLVSAPFRSVGADKGVAIEKTLFLARESERVLRERVPQVMKKLRILVGVVDLNTRNFHVLRKT